MSSKPSKIHEDLAAILSGAERGLSSGEVRRELQRLGYGVDSQSHADRRMRDLKQWWRVTKHRDGAVVRYQIHERLPFQTKQGVSAADRALVLLRGRCAMCGRTVQASFNTADHCPSCNRPASGVKLVVDHKVPYAWGGDDGLDNLQALCEECSAGKAHLFGSIDGELMRKVMAYSSVHQRIARTFIERNGQPVSSDMLSVIANQEDWQKRLRELRYLGWIIASKKRKLPTGKISISYVLEKQGEWREDMTQAIRDYEKQRANRKQREDSSGLASG